MNPFIYPKTYHKRKLSPPQRKNYRFYKPFLKKEFENKCIYCRLPDGMKDYDSFGVEHYKPKKKFPHLASDYTNLFYACNKCNSHKGQFWPTDTERELGIFIPNPCDHIMYDHLKYIGVNVKARSETGNFAIDTLRLNDDNFIHYRGLQLETIKALAIQVQRIRSTVERIEGLISNKSNQKDKDLLLKEKKKHFSRLQKLEKYFMVLTGKI